MAAVGQELLLDFTFENALAEREPPLRLGALKKHSGEQQRHAVLEQVVGENVILDVAGKPRCLVEQAREPGLLRRSCAVRSQKVINPVDDAQRGWIGLPRLRRSRRIGGYPVVDKGVSRRDRAGVVEQEIEVMQIVAPQPADVVWVPIVALGREGANDADELEGPAALPAEPGIARPG